MSSHVTPSPYSSPFTPTLTLTLTLTRVWQVVLDTLLDIVEEVARKIEEMMPGDQGGSVEAGKVNLAAFAKGCFSTDALGGFVDVMKVAGIE